eukprot:c15165_g1_i1.p1 GENE.c15165_g1_i1~~c15165_g1_i1.p1  ORF type:complete len:396 (+),score=88.68 c15165_g1_i1:589-1776(+)
MQLASGWMFPSDTLLIHELVVAAKQLNVDIVNAKIRLDVTDKFTAKLWAEFLSVNQVTVCMHQKGIALYQKGDDSVLVMQVLTAIFHRSNNAKLIGVLRLVSLVVAFCRTFLFGLLRYRRLRPTYGILGDTAESGVFVSLQMICFGMFYSFLLNFAMYSIIDIIRRAHIICYLGALIRTTQSERPEMPIILFEELENIACWITMRRVVVRWGYRFLTRITIYTVVSQILCVMFAIEAGSIAATTPRDFAKRDPRLYQALMDVSILLVPFTALLFFGARVNDRIQGDVESVIAHQVRLRALRADAHYAQSTEDMTETQTPAEHRTSRPSVGQLMRNLHQAESRNDLLDTAVQALKSLDASTPVRVLGLRADWRLLASVITVVVSYATFFGRYVFTL